MPRLIGKLRTRHSRWNSQPIELGAVSLAATTMPSSSPVIWMIALTLDRPRSMELWMDIVGNLIWAANPILGLSSICSTAPG